MNTVAYWIEKELTNVEALIEEFRGLADKYEDLADVYEGDADDFQTALSLFRQGDADQLAINVHLLDTAAREPLVEAFGKDCGVEFVEHVLGYRI